jgi:hypothetical protein
LNLSENALIQNKEAFRRLNDRVKFIERQVDSCIDLNPAINGPFRTSDLAAFGAQLKKLFFVFNFNDELLKDNQAFYEKVDLKEGFKFLPVRERYYSYESS